jgi:hypothetical protein
MIEYTAVMNGQCRHEVPTDILDLVHKCRNEASNPLAKEVRQLNESEVDCIAVEDVGRCLGEDRRHRIKDHPRNEETD